MCLEPKISHGSLMLQDKGLSSQLEWLNADLDDFWLLDSEIFWAPQQFNLLVICRHNATMNTLVDLCQISSSITVSFWIVLTQYQDCKAPQDSRPLCSWETVTSLTRWRIRKHWLRRLIAARKRNLHSWHCLPSIAWRYSGICSGAIHL